MNAKLKKELIEWLILGALFAGGAAGYWLTPNWSHAQDASAPNAAVAPR